MYDYKFAQKSGILAWLVFILLVGVMLDLVSGGLISGLIYHVVLKGLI